MVKPLATNKDIVKITQNGKRGGQCRTQGNYIPRKHRVTKSTPNRWDMIGGY